MASLSFNELVEDDLFYKELGSDIWVMDSHRWAYYIWEKFRASQKIEEKFSVVHIDYHWDGGNDFHDSPVQEIELVEGDLEAIYELVRKGNWIRFDSFISPAIIRGFVDEVHFYCEQSDGYDIGIGDELLQRKATSQFIHKDIQSVSSYDFKSPVIFDFCIDIFNRSNMYYQSDIWSDDEISEFLQCCQEMVTKASLVTVSFSFGYAGTEEDTRRLAEKVVKTFQEWRKWLLTNKVRSREAAI